jgi:hypothetical protein
LVRFFTEKGDTVANYLALDDFGVWTSIARVADGSDHYPADLACRLRERRLYKCLDVDSEYPADPGEQPEATEERRVKVITTLDERLADILGKTVFKDISPISAYGEVGAEHTKTHKMLAIKMKHGPPREITQLAPTIKAIVRKRSIVRYYFREESDRSRALAGEAP